MIQVRGYAVQSLAAIATATDHERQSERKPRTPRLGRAKLLANLLLPRSPIMPEQPTPPPSVPVATTTDPSIDTSTDATPPQRYQHRQQWIQRVLRWVGLPSGGLGFAATIALLRSGQFGLALLTGTASVGVVVLALAAKFVASVINKVLDRLDQRLETSSDSLADWIVAQVEAAVVALWWRITPQFRGAYYKSLIYAYRTYRTQGLKTPGQSILDFDHVFVPLRMQSKSLEQISPALIQRQETVGSLEVWDFLLESRREAAYKRMVIVGAPGSGKSTLLQHLTLTYAQTAHRRRSRQIPTLIPVLLPLHQIRDSIIAHAPDLTAVIVQQVKTLPQGKSLNLSPQWFESQLSAGRCLVMLDGLDEVADEAQRRQVSQWVDRQIQAYPEAFWLLTSRPYGYRTAPLTEARITLAVQGFSLGQMEQFLHRWYLQNEVLRQVRKLDPGVKAAAEAKADDLIRRVKQYPPLAAMALNPLLLTMIATVHDNRGALPGSRVDLYDEICDVLLVRRQEAKGLTEPFPLNAEQKRSVLQVLALALMHLNQRDFRVEQGLQIIAPPLQQVAGDRVSPAAFLKHIKEVTGLLTEREVGVYQFAHLSFQEYLASVQVKDAGLLDLLVGQIQQTWWHETIRLYAAKNDVTELVQAALATPTLNSLLVAYDCVETGKSVDAAVRQELERFSLQSPDPEIAQLAAKVKLKRRLTGLLRMDDDTEIDPGLISRAEYHLFLSDPDVPREADSGYVPVAWTELLNPEAPVTDLSLELALQFCCWLRNVTRNSYGLNTNNLADPDDPHTYFFRLPTGVEARQVRSAEFPELACWTLGSWGQAHGLRIVRTKLPDKFLRLERYLYLQDWQQASQVTDRLLQQAGTDHAGAALAVEAIPSGDLAWIDQLWVHYSCGRFGLELQAAIWDGIPGDDSVKRTQFRQLVGWQNESVSASSANLRPGYYPRLRKEDYLHRLLNRLLTCGVERGLPVAVFPVVRVNEQGVEVERRWGQARYRVEDVGGRVTLEMTIEIFSVRNNLNLTVEDLGGRVTLEMVAIPGGTFWMGAPEGESKATSDERPQHQVRVPAFFIGKYLVTQSQWRQVAALPPVNRNLHPYPAKFKGANRPVERVSWEDAVEFCDRLSRHTNRQYRLPTEAEWEYACRAGTTTPFHFGETITPDLANYDGNYTYGKAPKGKYLQRTSDVGSYPPNSFGLYDLHGNVWEWCADHWHESYEGAPTDGSAWLTGGDSDLRVLRGGSWYGYPWYCRSASRLRGNLGDRDDYLGFRVVCVVPRTP